MLNWSWREEEEEEGNRRSFLGNILLLTKGNRDLSRSLALASSHFIHQQLTPIVILVVMGLWNCGKLIYCSYEVIWSGITFWLDLLIQQTSSRVGKMSFLLHITRKEYIRFSFSLLFGCNWRLAKLFCLSVIISEQF